MKNKKVLLTSIIAVALLAVVTIGITIATLADNTQTLTNTFEPGDITTEIEEGGEGAVKMSRIKNTGKLDCLVRARVTISPVEAAEVIELKFTEHEDMLDPKREKEKADCWDWSNWKNGDGYVYYKAKLPADSGDDSYTGYLFTDIALDENADWESLGINTFDIAVYEESVQVMVHDGEKMISALDDDGNYDHNKALAVWAVYEASKAKK